MKLKIFPVATAFFLLIVSSISAAIPPAEKLLPADTLLMLTVPDYSALRASAQQSPQWLLWSDPAMKPFRDDFTAKWNARFVGPLERTLGLNLNDYLPLLQGQITFAVTQNGWNGAGNAAPSLLLLLDAKGKSDLLATNLAVLTQKWRVIGKPVRTEFLQDIKFSVVSLSSNTVVPFSSVFPRNAGAPSVPPTIYIGQYKSLLIVGTSAKSVESVAAHLTGGANPSLSQNAEFAADQLAQFHGPPLYYGWFNAKSFFDVLSQIQLSADSGPMPFSLDTVLLASGLRGLKSVSFSYRESRDGAEVEFFAAAPESGRQGLLKIVAPVPKDSAPPPFVPADVVKFWRWRVDGQKSWAEVQKTLGVVSPGVLTALNSFLDMANATARQQNPDFDIRKDLIANLGDDWMSYARPPGGATLADLNAAPWLFLFSADNPGQAVLALKTLAGMGSQGDGVATRDFLGRKIYTVTLPSHGGDGAAVPPRSIYFTASGGYVALTTDVSMIESFLRSDDGKTKPLSAKPELIQAAQHVGGMNNGLFGYQNQQESAQFLFAALKSDPAAGSVLNPLAALPLGSAANGIRDLMNFSLLPDYGQISKYFNFSVYGASVTSEGIDLKLFTPRPPDLN